MIFTFLLAIALGTWLGLGLRGPAFLGYYFAVFLVAIITAAVVRHTWRDETKVSLVAFLVFEAIGITRLITGLQQGMSRFGFLFAMMIIGGLLLFARAKEGGGYGVGGVCGGGCGSGCGGGCGGCGGCGG